jgi:carbamoyl-phosphate synthase small subunit
VKGLADWLKEHHIPGVFGLDTRMLTKRLRENGTMLGKLLFGNEDIRMDDPNKRNLVSEVSIRKPLVYEKGKKRVVVIDCGCKNNIIRSFLARNITVLRVPWDYDFFKDDFDGIIVSNGPGDPKMADKTIRNVERAIKESIPILGVCLGSQILGLAAGGNTFKLKYGHRSHNQPCVENGTKRCYITSQNHGYVVDTETLTEDWEQWFFNNNDRTNEGIRHKTKPFFGAQFHPEASPGPDDTEFIFDRFVELLK